MSVARRLNLIDTSANEDTDFGVELDDEIPTSLKTIELTEKHLRAGNTLKDMKLPEGSLVMMIRRENRYIVPNGSKKLSPGDVLLIIEEERS